MKIFSILKIDDEYSVIHYPLGGLRVNPRAGSPNQSGVTTTPLIGVSILLIRYLLPSLDMDVKPVFISIN
jgi:hypothetical protein